MSKVDERIEALIVDICELVEEYREMIKAEKREGLILHPKGGRVWWISHTI